MIERKGDQQKFVTQPYRAVVEKAYLRRELERYSAQYGHYVAIIPKDDGHFFDITISKEEGALLGEHIRDYFKDHSNLIYCEILKRGRVVLVVINDGEVFIDEVIDQTKLALELLPWIEASAAGGKKRFKIFYAGDGIELILQRVGMDNAAIQSAQRLNEPLFGRIEINEKLVTKALDTAIKEAGFSQGRRLILIGTILAVAITLLMTYLLWPKEKVVTKPIVNPYLSYEKALMRPSPNDILQAMATVGRELVIIPNVRMKKIVLKGSRIVVDMEKENRFSYKDLSRWADGHQATLASENNKIILSFSPHLPKRSRPDTIVILERSLYQLLDQLQHSLPGVEVKTGRLVAHGRYKTEEIIVSLTGASAPMIQTLASVLEDYPVVLQMVQLQWKEGLFDGKFQLQLLGKAS